MTEGNREQMRGIAFRVQGLRAGGRSSRLIAGTVARWVADRTWAQNCGVFMLRGTDAVCVEEPDLPVHQLRTLEGPILGRADPIARALRCGLPAQGPSGGPAAEQSAGVCWAWPVDLPGGTRMALVAHSTPGAGDGPPGELRFAARLLRLAVGGSTIREWSGGVVWADGATQLLSDAGFADAVARALVVRQETLDKDTVRALVVFELRYAAADRLSRRPLQSDPVVRALTQRLASSVRPSDLLGTVGAGFGVYLGHLRSPLDAVRTVEEIVRTIEQPLQLADRQLALSAAAGIALSPQDGWDVRRLLRKASLAARHAADSGSHTVCLASERTASVRRRRCSFVSALEKAAERNEFELRYQPVWDIARGRLVGLEALLRWQYQGQEVVPDRFIPIAEQTGLIHEIGAWALRSACQDARRWQIARRECLRVSVNVSGRQLRPGFAGAIVSALAEAELAPTALVLEITESVWIKHIESVRPELEQLRDLGVGIAVDDFGTGYSSLAYLHGLPITILKLDKRFVRTLPDGALSRSGVAIVRTLVDLCRRLGNVLVVEGVEEPSQLAWLARQGGRYAQGFLLGRPLPAVAVSAHLEAWTQDAPARWRDSRG